MKSWNESQTEVPLLSCTFTHTVFCVPASQRVVKTARLARLREIDLHSNLINDVGLDACSKAIRGGTFDADFILIHDNAFKPEAAADFERACATKGIKNSLSLRRERDADPDYD